MGESAPYVVGVDFGTLSGCAVVVRASDGEELDVSIATDFTACTVLPTTEDGTPLCQLDKVRERPRLHKAWKHHAAQPHADRVTEVAASRGPRRRTAWWQTGRADERRSPAES